MRARGKHEEWRRRVERWRRSGLTAEQFAEREGVRASTLAWWRWRLARDRSPAVTSERSESESQTILPTDFVELVPRTRLREEPDRGASGFEVELAAGYRVRLSGDFSGEAFKRLLDVLEAR
jgi:hypothetical protein